MAATARPGITRRFTVHGLRRSFNDRSRHVAGEIVTRSITGHVSQQMTEHYSHVGERREAAVAASVVKLVLGSNCNEDAPLRGGSGGDRRFR